jgi:hypothetical protein
MRAHQIVVLRPLLFLALLLGWCYGPDAGAGFRRPNILIVHSSTYAWDVPDKLASSGQFGTVSLLDARATTPTLAALREYDAVLVFSDAPFLDPATLGNNLADYSDDGGGVVSAAFSISSAYPITGRWTSGYSCIVPNSVVAPLVPASLDFASITDQYHPILLGVGSFSGGSRSFHMSQNNVVPGATIVAKWTDGSVLAAVGPLAGRADLNFYPPSANARSDFWDPATDGVKLMANALLYVCRPRVLVAAAPSTASWIDNVRSTLKATHVLGVIDTFNVSTGTPTLAQLRGYDAVLFFSDSLLQNATATGDALADYVDAGGGVVSAVFATSAGYSGARPLGRWPVTYELITGNLGQTWGTAQTLGTVTYPLHPTMHGVTTFNGGSSSYRAATMLLNPGAFNIAQWSDGRPLVVASTRLHNRADLGFFPPNSAVRADLWLANTDGGKIMANALLYIVKPYIGVFHADSNGPDTGSWLLASRRYSGVGGSFISPFDPVFVPLPDLRPFNAIVAFSGNYGFADPARIGNWLADFVDAGGGVVIAMPSNVNTGASYRPGGRWVIGGYDIVPSDALPNYTCSGPRAFLGALPEPAHPIASFVRWFDGGTASCRATTNPLVRGREVLRWSDGRMLASVHNFRRRADLGFTQDSTLYSSNAWNKRCDGGRIIANAVDYTIFSEPCPGDFNGDGQVDDSDFVLFALYYNELTDPRGDLNGDNNTDDADFQVFAQAYNELLCP